MERNPSALSSSPHNGISRKHRGRRAAGSGESATASPRARDQVRQENRRGRGAMSWQAYVDEHLLCDIDGQTSASPPRRRRHPRPRRRCLGAARCLPTGQTRRNHFRPVVMNDFNEPGSLAPTGLYLGGSKYMAIQGKPRVFIREKKGPGGVTIKKTSLAIITGIYEEPMARRLASANVVVERLGD